MEGVKTKLSDTKAKLEVQNFSGLTKDDLLGDLLFTAALSYYAEYDVLNTPRPKVGPLRWLH